MLRRKRIITIAILVLLVLHIAIALTLTFFDEKVNLGHSRLSRIYQHLVHLGPFYREEAIQTSPHFYVEARGSTTDLIAMHHQHYQDRPWKINELLLRDNVRRSADMFYRARKNPASKGYRRLIMATASSLRPEKNDSIRWTYLQRRYLPEKETWRNDTLFSYQFKWTSDEQ